MYTPYGVWGMGCLLWVFTLIHVGRIKKVIAHIHPIEFLISCVTQTTKRLNRPNSHLYSSVGNQFLIRKSTIQTQHTLKWPIKQTQWGLKFYFIGSGRSESSWKRDMLRGYYHWNGTTLIQAWISNYIICKVWDEITYLFINFNGATFEVWE